jgi:hypothetical protein
MKAKYITGILLVSALASCSDYLEAPTKSSLDEAVIFSTPGLAEGAVNGIKVPFAETNSYRGRYLPWYGMNTDVEWHNSSDNISDDNYDLVQYDAKAINDQMNTTNNVWAMMYSGIERANLCIRGLRTYGNPQPGSELGYLLGESLTLRAVYYADLLKTWGDVPMRFEPISSETLYLPKTNRDDIYKQLIADLGEAATLVPWPGESAATGNVERINKAFVKGLRARLCLAASGFSQYPDGIRRSEDPELSVANMYALALQECQDVIESGTAHLESSFETLWRKYNEDDVTAGGESLWEIPFADGRGRMLFTFAVRHTIIDQHQANGTNRGGIAGPLPHIFYDYDPADTRRDVTCVPYLYGNQVGSATTAEGYPFARQELTELDTWYFGKYRYEWMSRRVVSTNDDGVNKLYMRYAEVLLMAAEAANELNDIGTAQTYLKEIRRRAFPASEHATKVDAYVNALNSKDAMFNAIVDEHKFEFCGEMERKQALIRWNLLRDKLDEAKDKMYALRSRTGEYADVPENLFFKYESDGETLDIFGLNPGETAPENPGDYTEVVWVTPTAISDEKIETIYANDPNTKQFWPIWEVFINGSNGKLVNDYGY